ncbi:DnaD domain protein [Streptococcus salivarius]
MAKTKTKTKVYFWLKFDKKFFDNLFIKRLKSVNGGYAMTVIYIRLMLESLETDCILYYEGYFESLFQELALKLDVSEDDINMTLSYFTKCGLIQIDTDGNAKFPQAEALLEQETNWARYKRENRKVGQIPTNLDNVQRVSNQCPTEKEIEIEKELEKEVEEEEKTTTTTAPIFSQEFINLYNSFEQESGRPLSAIQQQELGYMLDEFNADLIYEALKEAVNQGKVNFAYIKAILARWKQDNLLTVDLVRNSKANRNKKEKEETLTSNFPPLPF